MGVPRRQRLSARCGEKKRLKGDGSGHTARRRRAATDSEIDTGCAHPPPIYTHPGQPRPSRPPSSGQWESSSGPRVLFAGPPPPRAEHLRKVGRPPLTFPALGKLKWKGERAPPRVGPELAEPASSAGDLGETEQLGPHCFPPPDP